MRETMKTSLKTKKMMTRMTNRDSLSRNWLVMRKSASCYADHWLLCFLELCTDYLFFPQLLITSSLSPNTCRPLSSLNLDIKSSIQWSCNSHHASSLLCLFSVFSCQLHERQTTHLKTSHLFTEKTRWMDDQQTTTRMTKRPTQESCSHFSNIIWEVHWLSSFIGWNTSTCFSNFFIYDSASLCCTFDEIADHVAKDVGSQNWKSFMSIMIHFLTLWIERQEVQKHKSSE
jgi:hypothetical protein